ncbi:tyrosyl-tRNA synthetase [Azorhizobium caulinodans ORS 571]|uniref:Tyrosine--tRNA ligase n=1 Tax=Azorhizobium caulinodans (strain ATCC 43989 / DSM 5975 / JCM 20966 / LMG 6465 / NBRC 14845 / NCIMB 13405 / ORS 571) TaxID=438753 RepID=A8IFI5_AZOC5|nr:tyrosine--tRNA ligase [Azorhizobium caulinodans]BAF89617.1 tyrosyl-tRNA synthetase [Azorhizobium caulinodans ORS 571]
MTTLRSDFLRTLQERGYIHQCSDLERLDAKASEGPITAYIGFDATASSLHAGHLLSIMMLRTLQRTGHRPIALMGGGTTKIGDPSGKDEARKMLTDAQINENIASIRKVFARFLDFEGSPKGYARFARAVDGKWNEEPRLLPAIMENNANWLDELKYIPLLREVGPHFTINRMLTFDSVKLRLEREQPLTFLEFNYMILQAYDFVELNKRHGCTLQMGGSDQWGNIVNGMELGRRMHGADLFALTTPLLTTSSGAKMGKTAGGAVWLDAALLSPYEYWQYWRNTGDADVERFLKLFTELPLDEIARLAALGGQEINHAKDVLATEATALLHGRAAAEEAKATARATFEEGALSTNLPTIEIPAADLKAGLAANSAFVTAGLVPSTSEARRQIKSGGLKVNDATVTDEKLVLGERDLTAEGVIKLSMGKKKHVLVRPV